MSRFVLKPFLLSLFIIYFCDSFAQNVIITLNIKNVDKNTLSFPCMSINDCIDSVYKYKDTLFILLQETRTFYQDRSGVFFVIESCGYRANNRNINVLVQDELISDFIILKTFDFVCIFQKYKKKYKSIFIEERADYSTKKILDLKDSNIIIRR